MNDNLKDAINHARETASKLRKMTSITNGKPYEECLECASEHEQLAAWLTELQERREADKKTDDLPSCNSCTHNGTWDCIKCRGFDRYEKQGR